jgi:hypothetical protein
MATANKVQANKPIAQTGALGYLLWLRHDLPAVYSSVAKKFPDVANFESALTRQAAGLGDDTDLSTIDTSSFDFGAAVDTTPVTFDFSFEPPVITLTPPDLPPVSIAPVDSSGAAGAAAASIPSQTLANIAVAVASTVPGLINVGSAVVNSQAVNKVIATSNAQVAAALAGKAPLQTGYVSSPSGAYLAPIASLTGSLTSSALFDLPLWVYLVAGVGLVAVLMAE